MDLEKNEDVNIEQNKGLKKARTLKLCGSNGVCITGSLSFDESGSSIVKVEVQDGD